MDIEKKIEQSMKLFKEIIKSSDYNKVVEELKGKEKLPRFVFSGVGKNWYICEKVVKTYLSMGIQCEALDCVHALHGDLGMLVGDEEKVLVFVSKSGTTKELVEIEKIVKKLREIGKIKNTTVVGFFLNTREKVHEELFDMLITLPDGFKYEDIYEFDERNIVPSLSINTMQMVLDLIGVTLYESRSELVENYVYNHLGGNNGARLGARGFLSEI